MNKKYLILIIIAFIILIPILFYLVSNSTGGNMAYLELYKKYRPDNFDKVIGQDSIVKSLKNAIVEDTLPTAYLFAGTAGTGKTTLALIVAKALNCENRRADGNPCNECATCKAIDNNALLGVKYITMAENGSADSIRKIMEESRLSQPIKKKVFILDETQNLSSAAQDAMLIGLEDKKQKTLFIFCSTDPQKIKPAVLSRAQTRQLREPSVKELFNHLLYIVKQEPEILEKFKSKELSKESLIQCAMMAGGSVRNAIGNLEALISSGSLPTEYSTKVLDAIVSGDPLNVYQITNQMSQDGIDYNKTAEQIYKSLVDLFRNLNGIELENQALIDISNKLNIKTVPVMIDIISKTLSQVKNKVIDYRILYEVCFIKMLMAYRKQEVKNDVN